MKTEETKAKRKRVVKKTKKLETKPKAKPKAIGAPKREKPMRFMVTHADPQTATALDNFIKKIDAYRKIINEDRGFYEKWRKVTKIHALQVFTRAYVLNKDPDDVLKLVRPNHGKSFDKTLLSEVNSSSKTIGFGADIDFAEEIIDLVATINLKIEIGNQTYASATMKDKPISLSEFLEFCILYMIDSNKDDLVSFFEMTRSLEEKYYKFRKA